MAPTAFTVLLLCLPLAAALAGWAAERTELPYPLLVVVLGALMGLLPCTKVPVLSPQLVLFGFLPPLLYYAAYFIAPEDLRANARQIGLLAVGLVVITMVAVTATVVGILGIPLGVAAVIGAVVAPTDPVAATAVFRRLNAPERLVTVVEGEGLINDGTALVLYGGAVAAVEAATLRPGRLAATLLVAPLGGIALGLAIAWILVQIRRRIDLPLVEITLSLATPYLTYVLAQAAGLSGVLATVAAGVFVGSRTGALYAPGARLQAFAFLDVLVHLLNAVLFILVGLQLVHVLHRVPGVPTARLISVLAAVVAVVVGVRLAWMLLQPAVARPLGRTEQQAGCRERIVIGWVGMRGGVSLAAALAVPLQRADGSPFPYRELVNMVAAAVVVTTLVVQGISLPWLLRRLQIVRQDPRNREHTARLRSVRAALAWLDDHVGGDGADDAAASLRALYMARLRRLEATDSNASDVPFGGRDSRERYTLLRLELLSVERSVVSALRQEGRINAAEHRSLERNLDLEEARIRGS